MLEKLPSTWDCQPLHAVAEVRTGLAKGKKVAGDVVSLPYLRVANVQDGFLDLTEIKEILVERREVQRYLLREGDVLLTEGGDFDKLGRGHIWRGEIPSCLHQNHVFAVRTNPRVLDPRFFAALATSPYGKRYFLSCAKQTTNLASINSTQLRQFPVLLPPLAEQRRIAEILAAWDEAIALTERLIEAKRKRKQGLVQRLLTRQLRFKEFEGQEWKETKLADVFERVQRKVPAGVSNVLSISARIGFELQSQKFSRVIAGKSLASYVMLMRGEFSYNKGNSKAYPQGCIYRLDEYEEGAVPRVYYSFRACSGLTDSDFFKFLFESGALNRQLRRLIDTGVRNDGLLNITADDFFDCNVSIPPLAEQKKIAGALTAATEEIGLLDRKLALLREQKKGLMQQLLTGKVRVK